MSRNLVVALAVVVLAAGTEETQESRDHLVLRDSKGRVRCELGALDDKDTCGLRLYRADGSVSLDIHGHPIFGPTLALHDRSGAVRMRLRLDEVGAPNLSMFADDGKRAGSKANLEARVISHGYPHLVLRGPNPGQDSPQDTLIVGSGYPDLGFEVGLIRATDRKGKATWQIPPK